MKRIFPIMSLSSESIGYTMMISRSAKRTKMLIASFLLCIPFGYASMPISSTLGGGPSWSKRPLLSSLQRDVPQQPTTAVPLLDTATAATKKNGIALSNNYSPRGGEVSQNVDLVVRVVGTVTQLLISCGRTVLPPAVSIIKAVACFYRALPKDAVVAQIGLVYCFAGGYYPTLFSSLQAAQQCGLHVMAQAIHELSEEAIKVIDATAELRWNDVSRREMFLRQTNIVMKTVDPLKINTAAAALYTTWLGVSAVLEREFARVISLSLSLAGYFETVAHWVLEPPVRLCVNKDYHKWVPVSIGWLCKAAAMNIAWRIQRVLTASTSAMAGGLMFSRALLRMMRPRKSRFFGSNRQEREERNILEDIIGFAIAGVGFYTQIRCQYKNNFSFEIPFPISLVTWPFDWAEKSIQWQITKE